MIISTIENMIMVSGGGQMLMLCSYSPSENKKKYSFLYEEIFRAMKKAMIHELMIHAEYNSKQSTQKKMFKIYNDCQCHLSL